MRELTAEMDRDSGHRVHVRFCDVLDNNRDVEVPGADGLVIGGGHEPSVLVNEGDCVHWSEMLVVFLGNLAGVDIILCHRLSN